MQDVVLLTRCCDLKEESELGETGSGTGLGDGYEDWDHRVDCVLTVAETSSGSLVRVRVQPVKALRIALFVITGGWMSMLFLFMQGLADFFESLPRLGSQGHIFFYAFGLTFFLLTWIGLAMIFRQVEARLRADLGSRFPLEIFTPEDQTGFSPLTTTLLLQLGVLSLVSLFWVVGLTTAFAVALLLYASGAMRTAMEITFRDQPYVQWKVRLAHAITHWSHHAYLILICLVFAYYVNLGIHFGPQLETMLGWQDLKRALARLYFVPSPPTPLGPELHAVGFMLRAALVALLGLSAVQALIHLRMDLREPTSWATKVGSLTGHPTLPRMDMPSAGGSLATRWLLVTNFGHIVVMSWLSMLLLVGIGSHAALGLTFPGSLSILLDWFYLAPPPELGVSPTLSGALAAATAVFLIILCLPFGMAMVLTGASHLRARRDSREPPESSPDEDVEEFIGNVAADLGIPVPSVVIIEDPRLSVSSIMLRMPGEIRITRRALEELSRPELAAAVAHEIGHLKLHWPLLRRLRRWSSATIYCPNYLSLLVDFVGAEHDADDVALSLCGDRAALRSAVVKLAAGLGDEPEAESAATKDGGVREYFRVFYGFFFEPAILGAAHPRMRQRLDYIDSWGA